MTLIGSATLKSVWNFLLSLTCHHLIPSDMSVMTPKLYYSFLCNTQSTRHVFLVEFSFSAVSLRSALNLKASCFSLSIAILNHSSCDIDLTSHSCSGKNAVSPQSLRPPSSAHSLTHLLPYAERAYAVIRPTMRVRFYILTRAKTHAQAVLN